MTPTDGPVFGKGASHVSDVRFTHALTPDQKTLSILFENFSIRLEPGGAPVAARMVLIVFPLTGGTADTMAKVDLRGAATLQAGATGTVIVRAFGETHVLEPLFDTANPGTEESFMKELTLKVPAGRNTDMTLILIAERGPNLRDETRVTLDAIEMSVGPAKAT